MRQYKFGFMALRALLGVLALMLAAYVQAGQWVSGSFGNSAGSREYKVWLPTGYMPGKAMPLVMMLHGCGSNAQKIAEVTRWNAVADREGIVVVYPEQNVWASLMLCWNWGQASQQGRDVGEPSILMGMLRQVAASYATDPRRQYVAGFSAGAGMVAILAACNADSFAAAAIHSGGMYKAASNLFDSIPAMSKGSTVDPDQSGVEAWRCSLMPRAAMPVLVVHGSADPTVNPVNGAQAAQQFVQFNDMTDDSLDNNSVAYVPTSVLQMPPAVFNGYPYTVTNYHDVTGKLLVRHVLVTGLDHHWSGGAATSGRSAEPYGPDATEMVWGFFKDRSK